MRVFVTGATGYIGTAVVKALVDTGHRVTGLARSADGEARLRHLRATPVGGDLADPASYGDIAAAHDALVHIGFETGPEGVAIDRRTVDALIDVAHRRDSPTSLIYTSGVLCLGNTGDLPADEEAPANAIPLVAWRPAHERLVLEGGTDHLATAVIRPGFVYGGVKGLLAGYFQTATEKGAAEYVGDGRNRMSLVHRDDLAQLYRIVVERRARGIFHGVDGSSPRIAELAKAASEAAGRAGATRAIPLEETRGIMGPFADALCTDQVVVARRSGALGWAITHEPVLEGMAESFEEWRAHR
jgi:nucleoside-diphosphate-sugar epimerase